MSEAKPWAPHYFKSMQNRPKSCQVCGGPALHENHPGPLLPRLEIERALARPSESIFASQAEPAKINNQKPEIPESARLMHGEIQLPQYEEFLRSWNNQQEVLMMALAVFSERNKLRKDLWARADPIKNLEMAREKLDRVETMFDTDAPLYEMVDDALDCINYMVFVIRKITGMVPQ